MKVSTLAFRFHVFSWIFLIGLFCLCKVTAGSNETVSLPMYNAEAGAQGFIVGTGVCQCGRSSGRHPLASRIIIASASENDIPWTATLARRNAEKSWQIFCGGTLINDQYILTASHCVDKMESKDIYVFLNEESKLLTRYTIENALRMDVSKIILHPEFNPNTYLHDIAILKLTEPVYSSISLPPACLPIANDQYHTKYNGTITSWVHNPMVISLQKINLTLISVDQCKRQSHGHRISDSMICAGSVDNTDSCQGDSGGPLTITRGDRQFLIGIASWGLPCPNPSVYTRVVKYIDWIVKNTPDAEWCVG